MARFAISGSNGFIGQHLVRHLRAIGNGVLPIPRFFLRDPVMLQETFEAFPPDYVIHLAAYGNHSKQNEPHEMLNVNVIGTFNLLAAIENIPIKGFINIGSSSEYGIKNEPMRETDFLETDTFYGATKVASTYLSRAFAKFAKKNVVTVRPFSVYGPGEASFRFIPTMCQSLIQKKFVTLAGEPVHDWIYVQDFIDGLMRVIENMDTLSGQVVNIGTGTQYSNAEIVTMLEDIAGSRIQLDVFGMADMKRSYDSTTWVADNTKLKGLGWEQKHTIMQGLEKVYSYEKQKFEAQST